MQDAYQLHLFLIDLATAPLRPYTVLLILLLSALQTVTNLNLPADLSLQNKGASHNLGAISAFCFPFSDN